MLGQTILSFTGTNSFSGISRLSLSTTPCSVTIINDLLSEFLAKFIIPVVLPT